MIGKRLRTILALGVACAALGLTACATSDARTASALAAKPAATSDEALKFLDEAEKKLTELNEYASRASWVRATNITMDSNYIATRADSEVTAAVVTLAKESTRFDAVPLPPPSAQSRSRG